MFKHILLVTACVSPSLNADWIDDLAAHAQGDKLNQGQAVSVMETYINKDKEEIKELERKVAGNTKKGVVSYARGGAYKAQIKTASARMEYHQRVLTFINGLPKNENERKEFAKHLSDIRVTQEELTKLKAASSKTGTLKDAVANTGSIAAKELYVAGAKKKIESSFLVIKKHA